MREKSIPSSSSLTIAMIFLPVNSRNLIFTIEAWDKKWTGRQNNKFDLEKVIGFHSTFTGDGKPSPSVWLTNPFESPPCFMRSCGRAALVRKQSHLPCYQTCKLSRACSQWKEVGTRTLGGDGSSWVWTIRVRSKGHKTRPCLSTNKWNDRASVT